MKGPRSLKSLIAGWTPHAGRNVVEADHASSAFAAAWEAAVGLEVARRSRPTKFRNGVLTILTASSAWSDELSLHGPRIITALQRAFPEGRLHKLRFMVASGRTRLLLDRERSQVREAPKRQANSTASPIERGAHAGVQDLASALAQMTTRQHTLDAERDSAGWKLCATCERRFLPESPRVALCAPCAEAKRRAAHGAIERALMQAPWLSFAQLQRWLPQTSSSAYERTKQRLLARWQSDIESAQRRLRRGTLSTEDRVVAWSYLMLSSGLAQRDIGRAVVTDVLGRDWMNVLFGDGATQNQEARRPPREKQKR